MQNEEMKLSSSDLTALTKIKKIVEKGYSAEVKSKNGALVIYSVTKKIAEY